MGLANGIGQPLGMPKYWSGVDDTASPCALAGTDFYLRERESSHLNLKFAT